MHSHIFVKGARVNNLKNIDVDIPRDKLVVLTMGQFVVSVYGAEDLVDTFRDKLQNCFSSAAVVYDEPIA